MDQDADPHEIVFRSMQYKASSDARLVLESAGITSELIQHNGTWILLVSEQDQVAAIAELDAYHKDTVSDVHSAQDRVPVFGGAGSGVFCYALIILAVFVLSDSGAYDIDWFDIGRMQAGQVVSGQWWRTVTALTLHADASHLLSNLIFGGVFGLLAGRILGGGVAWLTILIGGALGNLLNAMFRPIDHSSIGASTTVFAALGIMVAHALSQRPLMGQKAMKRWSPLIAGILMLAFIGVGGERTDVGAHVTGFLAGLLVGWGGCRLPSHRLANPSVQISAGLVALAGVLLSWSVALIF